MSNKDRVNMPLVTCWSTATDIPGTNYERKTYFLTIQDGDRRIEFSLQHFPADNRIVAEPYQPADYDYTAYDDIEDVDDVDDEDYF